MQRNEKLNKKIHPRKESFKEETTKAEKEQMLEIIGFSKGKEEERLQEIVQVVEARLYEFEEA